MEAMTLTEDDLQEIRGLPAVGSKRETWCPNCTKGFSITDAWGGLPADEHSDLHEFYGHRPINLDATYSKIMCVECARICKAQGHHSWDWEALND